MTWSKVELLEVPLANRKLVERFIRVPWFVHRIHAPNPTWVPPLLMDRRDFLNPRKNPFFDHADCRLWLAHADGQDIGRIAAVHDHDYVAFHKEKVGSFGLFECVNQTDIAQALIARAMSWLRDQGLTRMIGPLDLSTNHVSGALIDAFDKAPAIQMPYNPPYYPELFRACNLEKAKDLFSWCIDTLQPMEPRIVAIAERLLRKENIHIRPISYHNWSQEVKTVLEIYNETWQDNWGFVPLRSEEFAHLAKDLKLVMHPELALLAEFAGKPVGFALTVFDINPILKKLNGRLLPTGILKLVWDLKISSKIKHGRLVLFGIRPAYRSYGIDSLLLVRTHQTARKLNLTHGELGWTLEDNHKINRLIELVGGKRVATYRVYSIGL